MTVSQPLRAAQGRAQRLWWAFERGTLWAMDLAGEGQAQALPPASVSPRIATIFDEVHRESAEALAKAMSLPNPRPVLRRLVTGRRCFAAWVDGQIAAYGWVSQVAECIGELERKFQVQPGEAYIWDCVTLPAYRRQRLYSALLSHIVAVLRGEGVRRAWIGSSLSNRPSIQGFANAGFEPVIRLICARLFNLHGLWLVSYPSAPAALVAAAQRSLIADDERTWGHLVIGRSGLAQLRACAQIEA